MSHKVAKPYACLLTKQSQRHSGEVGIRPIYKVFVAIKSRISKTKGNRQNGNGYTLD